MQIESEQTLLHYLKNKINLFLGAGFSLYAFNDSGKRLPTGKELNEELKSHFQISNNFNLQQTATILNQTRKSELREFLNNRFRVKTYDERYSILQKVRVNAIYTTNIDNLVLKIYENDKFHYINDVNQNGPSFADKIAIDYHYLHGCIINPNRSLVFDSYSLASTYSSSRQAWSNLVRSINQTPTLFWGYSLNDNSTLQALRESELDRSDLKERWILLSHNEIEYAEYFRSLGFLIIEGNTEEFLEYLHGISWNQDQTKPTKYEDIEELFSSNTIPKFDSAIALRPIKFFFSGSAPIWSDIFNKQIPQLSNYLKAKEKIFGDKNLIIVGAVVSGKTTVMMQLAAFFETSSVKLVFDNLTSEKARFLINKLGGRPAIVFIDNFSDSIDAVDLLSNEKNIKLICCERSHQFGIISHLINEKRFNFINITQLSEKDIQDIFNAIPEAIRKEKMGKEFRAEYERDSLFEFINRNVKSSEIKVRYKLALEEMEEKSYELAEILILSSYFHYTRVPISFEVIYSYFGGEFSADEVQQFIDQLSDSLKEYSGNLLLDNDQDYYYPRSIYIAETILEQCDSRLLKCVIENVIDNIPNFRISYYDNFRKRAFDKNIISRAFINWEEGKKFYESAYEYDFKNPYILQQGALYLSLKKQYNDAFTWIDKALTDTDNKYFSIRNSHAIILFEANINSSDNIQIVTEQLDLSMSILEKCYRSDKRKYFHCIRYAEQAIQYHTRFPGQKTHSYLASGLKWLEEITKDQNWDLKSVRLKDEIKILIKRA